MVANYENVQQIHTTFALPNLNKQVPDKSDPKEDSTPNKDPILSLTSLQTSNSLLSPQV